MGIPPHAGVTESPFRTRTDRCRLRRVWGRGLGAQALVAGLCGATGTLAWRCGWSQASQNGRAYGVLEALPALELSKGVGGRGVSMSVGFSECLPQFGFPF